MVHYLPRSSKVFPRRRREEPCTKVRILLDVPKSASGTADLLQGACLHRGDILHDGCTLLGLTYKQGNLPLLFLGGQIPMPGACGHTITAWCPAVLPPCAGTKLLKSFSLLPVEVLEIGASTGTILLNGTWRGPLCHRLSEDTR